MTGIDLSLFDDVTDRLSDLRKDIGSTNSDNGLEVVKRVDELADILGDALSLIRDKLAEATSN